MQHPVIGQEPNANIHANVSPRVSAEQHAKLLSDLKSACIRINQLSRSEPEESLAIIETLLRDKLPANVRRALNSSKMTILIRDEKYAEALAAVSDRSQIDGDTDYYLCLQSFVLIHQGKFEQALAAANKAVDLEPEHSSGHLYLAECFYHLRQLPESEKELRQAERLEKYPSPDFFVAIAPLYGRLGAFADQKRILLSTIKRWPDNAHSFLYLGLAAGFDHQKAKALQYFKQGTDTGKDADTNLMAAEFCYLLDYDTAGLEFADQAVRMSPTSVRAFLQKSKLLSRLGRNEEALSTASRAVELGDKHIPAWIQKVECLSALSRAEEALACAETALALEPQSADLRLLLATTHCRARHYTKAIELTTQILQDDPGSARAFRIRGQSRFELRQNWDAVEDFTMAHTCSPSDSGPLLNRAATYMALQMPGNALADINQILRREPTSSMAYDMRAQALRRLGQTELANADVKKAAQLRAQYDHAQE